MPILALEGPDRCGKSSLMAELRKMLSGPTFIGALPLPPQLVQFMPYLELRQESLFAQMYDPQKLYICDRSFAVSAEVYSKVFQRPLLIDAAKWRSEHLVVYLDVPVAVLVRRHVEAYDPFPLDLYTTCKAVYAEVLKQYCCMTLDGCKPSAQLAEELVCSISTVTGGFPSTPVSLQQYRRQGSSKLSGTS